MRKATMRSAYRQAEHCFTCPAFLVVVSHRPITNRVVRDMMLARQWRSGLQKDYHLQGAPEAKINIWFCPGCVKSIEPVEVKV